MFKRKKKAEEDEWDLDNGNWNSIDDDWRASDDFNDLDDWQDKRKFRLPKSFMVMAVLFVLVGGGLFLGYQLWWWTTPAYAAEDWFEGVWSLDGEKVLNRTCTQEIWFANSVIGGSVLYGMMDYVDLGVLLGLPPDLLDVKTLLKQVRIDLAQIRFEELASDGNTAVVTAKGPIRFSIASSALPTIPLPVNESWLMVQEDNQWKWCGYYMP